MRLTPIKDEEAPDIIALNAKDGKFDPFSDIDLTAHLGVEGVTSLQTLDLPTGRWITHLRSSPSISVTNSCTIHMKRKETNLEGKESIAISTALTSPERTQQRKPAPTSGGKRKAKRNDSLEIIDLTGVTDLMETMKVQPEKSPRKKQKHEERSASPLGLRSFTDESEAIGARPARIATFPAKTAKEMITRFEWIALKETKENVQSRFETVFSCKYRRSTYYKHKKLWSWLSQNGALENISDTDLWSPLTRVASGILKKTEGAEDSMLGSEAEAQ